MNIKSDWKKGSKTERSYGIEKQCKSYLSLVDYFDVGGDEIGWVKHP